MQSAACGLALVAIMAGTITALAAVNINVDLTSGPAGQPFNATYHLDNCSQYPPAADFWWDGYPNNPNSRSDAQLLKSALLNNQTCDATATGLLPNGPVACGEHDVYGFIDGGQGQGQGPIGGTLAQTTYTVTCPTPTPTPTPPGSPAPTPRVRPASPSPLAPSPTPSAAATSPSASPSASPEPTLSPLPGGAAGADRGPFNPVGPGTLPAFGWIAAALVIALLGGAILSSRNPGTPGVVTGVLIGGAGLLGVVAAGMALTGTDPGAYMPFGDRTPIARLAVTPNGESGADFTADLSDSHDSDGDPLKYYAVDWGDGTVEQLCCHVPFAGSIGGTSSTHVYDRSGGYTVTATVKDAAGNQAQRKVDIKAIHNIDLVAIEVNQSVQDLDNSIPLIEDKLTWVRVHLQPRDGGSASMTATLSGTRGGVALPLSPLSPANGGSYNTITSNAVFNRRNFASSMNFQLPASWLKGTIELTFGGATEPVDCNTKVIGSATDCKVTVSFEATLKPSLKYVGVAWDQGKTSNPSPSLSDLLELDREVEAIYPIATSDFHYSTTKFSGTVDSDNRKFLRALNADMLVLQVTECPYCNRYYYAALLGKDQGGLANDRPGSVASGTISLGWDYARHRQAHELGHDLGLPHDVTAGAPVPTGADGADKYGYCGEAALPSTPDYPYLLSSGGSNFYALGPMDKGEAAKVFGLDSLEARHRPGACRGRSDQDLSG